MIYEVEVVYNVARNASTLYMQQDKWANNHNVPFTIYRRPYPTNPQDPGEIIFIWKFTTEEDAALFKLTWL